MNNTRLKNTDKSEFANLLEQARKWAASEGINENDISEAIKAARKKS